MYIEFVDDSKTPRSKVINTNAFEYFEVQSQNVVDEDRWVLYAVKMIPFEDSTPYEKVVLYYAKSRRDMKTVWDHFVSALKHQEAFSSIKLP